MYILLLTLLFSQAWALPLTQQSQSGPVISQNFPDPSSLKVGNIWVAYSGPNGNPDINVITAVSSDFCTWTVNNIEALPNPGIWANRTAHVWAPDVVQLPDKQFLMYYTAATAKDDKIHCIGYAKSYNPVGPFVASEEPLFCDFKRGGSIDPDGFLDPVTGKRFIVYKMDGNAVGHGGLCGNTIEPIIDTPLILQEVDVKDGVTLIGEGKSIMNNLPEDGPTIEAPSLYFDPDSKTYILLFTSGCYSSLGYTIQLATATSVEGPYTRRGTWLATGGTSAKVSIPGSPDFEASSGRLIFHGDTDPGDFHDNDGKRTRAMYAATMNYRADGATLRDLL